MRRQIRFGGIDGDSQPRFIHAGKDTGGSGPSHGCEAISVFGLVKRNELVACKGVTHVEIEITADDKGRIGTVLTPAGK